VQEGISFLPSSSGREFKEEEFIGTVGCKSSSQGRCTPYNHQDGWMDGQAFNEWVCQVIKPYVAARDNSVLIFFNNFSVHMQHDNITSLQILGAEVEFIPGVHSRTAGYG
jgi:hypothetical protein